MAEETVWFSDENVTIYHLFYDCQAMHNVHDDNIAETDINLDKDGHALHDATMRLCGHCDRRRRRQKRSLRRKLRWIRKQLRQ